MKHFQNKEGHTNAGGFSPKEGEQQKDATTCFERRAEVCLQRWQQTWPPAFALLIDADNIGAEQMPEIVNRAESLGVLTLRRAYGNQEVLFGHTWKEVCLHYAIQPMLHLGISGVHNATDIALVVDAMDVFHTQAIRRFCLVTGDQDFTALVLRLRSYGCLVYGIGKPSKALSRVCTAFFPLDGATAPVARPEMVAPSPLPTTIVAAGATEIPTPLISDPALTHLFLQAMADLIQETHLEWIPVSRLGARLKQLDAHFAAKTYGLKSLPLLCKARSDLFEWRPLGVHLEVRLKPGQER